MNIKFLSKVVILSFFLLLIQSTLTYAQVEGVKSIGKISKPTTVKKIGKIEGIDGFYVQYSDKLYRGGLIVSEQAIVNLKEKGITRIVCADVNKIAKKSAKQQGIKYYTIKFNKKTGLTKKTFSKFLKATISTSDVYFFSCSSGKHRAGIFSAMFRMKYDGWTYEEAMREYIKLGGDPIGDKLFMDSVKELSGSTK